MMTLSPAPHANEATAGSTASACPEADLIRATLDGNARAFEQIVNGHHRRVFQFLYQLMRHREDAEDVTQQTFVKAYHSLARFDPQRPLINWLLTIARNTALNHFRSAKQWTELPYDAADRGPSPADAAEISDRATHLWDRARATLSPREFEIMWLRFGEELSTEETARIVGLTQTHVKVLVFRARRALQKGEQRA